MVKCLFPMFPVFEKHNWKMRRNWQAREIVEHGTVSVISIMNALSDEYKEISKVPRAGNI